MENAEFIQDLESTGMELSDPPLLSSGTLITVKTAMKALNVCRSKFYAMIKEGKVRPIKFGKKCTRIRADELIELISGA